MINNNLVKLVTSSLLLAFSLTACGSGDTSLLNAADNQDAMVAGLSVDSNILQQIQQNTVEQTDWGTLVKALPVVKQPKKATLLSYMAFDNDKGGYRDELRPMINFHELSGSSNIMNLVLETDGAEAKDVKRYFVINDNDTTKIVSPYTQFKNEMDTSNYRTLQSFARWGFSNYPSEKKLLDIDNHGAAFMGIATDETSGKMIPLPNLAKAVQSAAGKVDILNMDACLMGTIEVTYELKDVADVIIGSQDSTIATGMMYTKSVPAILANTTSNEEIARAIVLST
jgi:hypothetical protein